MLDKVGCPNLYLWQLEKTNHGDQKMLQWISANIGNILITLFLILIVALCIFSIVRDKKRGKSSCGGSCAGCKMCGGSCPKH